MDLAAGAGQLDGELVVEVERDVTAVVEGFIQYDTSVNLLSDGHVLVEDLKATEDRHLVNTALTQVLGIDDVKAALSAHEDEPVGGIAHGTLVVGTVLQAVTVVIATYHEAPRAVLLLLGDDVRHAMVGREPYRLVDIFNKTVDGRAEETRLHIEQIDVTGLTVPDGGTLRRTLPEESAAVFECGKASLGNGYVIHVLGDIEVQDLEGLGIDIGDVFRMRHMQPSLLGRQDQVDIVAGNARIADTERPHLSRMLVDALHTGTQRTYPDIAPHVFAECPDVVGLETGRVVRSLDVRHLTVLNVDDTTLIGTKPHGAVTGYK